MTRDRVFELELIDAVARLRERVASMEMDLSHLHRQADAHTGYATRTDGALAHMFAIEDILEIASSLREAHRLIEHIQAALKARSERQTGPERLAPWIPALIGGLALLAALLGQGELAKHLLTLR